MPMVTSKDVRFTAEEFFRMTDGGVFNHRRMELLNGRIYKVAAAQSSEHIACLTRANIIFARHFSDVSKVWLITQGTVRLEEYSAPEPDFAVIESAVGSVDLPTPSLAVEVSFTTYNRDVGPKLRDYAAAGIQDYWIINVRLQRVEVYRKPINRTDGKWESWAYDSLRTYSIGESISPLRFPDLIVAVADFFPPTT